MEGELLMIAAVIKRAYLDLSSEDWLLRREAKHWLTHDLKEFLYSFKLDVDVADIILEQLKVSCSSEHTKTEKEVAFTKYRVQY